MTNVNVEKIARKRVACCFLQLPCVLILAAAAGTFLAYDYDVLFSRMGMLLAMFSYLIVACFVGVARYSDVVRDYIQQDLPEQWARDEANDEEQCAQCTARCCAGSALFFGRHTQWMKTMTKNSLR